ncbi:hypothetical protein CR513_45577, partial [Mucuna pruriens]
MAAHIYDDKILIHCFQDSLTGATLIWYVSLERGHIKIWRDLAKSFLKQYKYNEDMAPDRSWLQNMIKKEQEGFKEYAQRWCELAVQVQPPITEREMVTMFIDTLPSLYYDKVVGNVTSNFTDLVVVGKRIELGIRREKFTHTSKNMGLAKKPTLEKKKGKTNAMLVEPVFPLGKGNTLSYPVSFHIGARSTATYASPPLMPYVPPYQPRADTRVATNSRSAQQGTRRLPRMFTPIPMPYTELLL